MDICTSRAFRFKRTGKRNEIFIATKFGFNMEPGGKPVIGVPEYVPKAAEKSLSRLGVDYIDLYYLHRYIAQRDLVVIRTHALRSDHRADPEVPIEVRCL